VISGDKDKYKIISGDNPALRKIFESDKMIQRILIDSSDCENRDGNIKLLKDEVDREDNSDDGSMTLGQMVQANENSDEFKSDPRL